MEFNAWFHSRFNVLKRGLKIVHGNHHQYHHVLDSISFIIDRISFIIIIIIIGNRSSGIDYIGEKHIFCYSRLVFQRLAICGLASEELLWELFVQAGPVINVYVPKDRVTNLHQGYGFVEFRSEEDAD